MPITRNWIVVFYFWVKVISFAFKQYSFHVTIVFSHWHFFQRLFVGDPGSSLSVCNLRMIHSSYISGKRIENINKITELFFATALLESVLLTQLRSCSFSVFFLLNKSLVSGISRVSWKRMTDSWFAFVIMYSVIIGSFPALELKGTKGLLKKVNLKKALQKFPMSFQGLLMNIKQMDFLRIGNRFKTKNMRNLTEFPTKRIKFKKFSFGCLGSCYWLIKTKQNYFANTV